MCFEIVKYVSLQWFRNLKKVNKLSWEKKAFTHLQGVLVGFIIVR